MARVQKTFEKAPAAALCKDSTRSGVLRRPWDGRHFGVAQISNLSVSPEIVAAGANFLPAKETAETRWAQRFSEAISSLRSSRLCGFLGFSSWLRLRCAALYHRFPIGQASDAKQAGMIGSSVSRLETCDTAQRGGAQPDFLECGGKRSATPLWLPGPPSEKRCRRCALPPHSKIVAACDDSERY